MADPAAGDEHVEEPEPGPPAERIDPRVLAASLAERVREAREQPRE